MCIETVLFDREEANLSVNHSIKRYEDVFNCRMLLFGFGKEDKPARQAKFLNMDYPILYENLKRQLINKKIKLDKKEKRLKLTKNHSSPNNATFLSSPQHSASGGIRKRSFLKNASSPLSALNHTIKEETCTDFANNNNNSSSSSKNMKKTLANYNNNSEYNQSAIESDSSDSLEIGEFVNYDAVDNAIDSNDEDDDDDDDNDGEDMHFFSTTRSHRLSLSHSEEKKISDFIENPSQSTYNKHQKKRSTVTGGAGQYFESNVYEEIFSIHVDFQNFQTAETFKHYKTNITKNTLLANKPMKCLNMDHCDSFDKTSLLQPSLEDLDIDYSKYPELENQDLIVNLLEVNKNDLLNSSSLSSIQRLQITQADAFVFELRDCSMVLDNPYLAFDQKDALAEILQELEQLIPIIYENMDPSSQNLETPFMFTCCTCNGHRDNNHTIENGSVRQLNPKLVKFFKDLGINYRTSFYPTTMQKDVGFQSSERLADSAATNAENNYNSDARPMSFSSNSVPTIRNNENINHLTATVNHDTGRLMVMSTEEVVYNMTRKIVNSKLDAYYQVERKNGTLASSSHNGSSSGLAQRESAFFVSKDVRESTNRTPPFQSPSFTNSVVFNNSITRLDSDQLYTPTTENYTLHSQLTDSNMNYFNNQNKARSNASSPIMYRAGLKSEATAASNTAATANNNNNNNNKQHTESYPSSPSLTSTSASSPVHTRNIISNSKSNVTSEGTGNIFAAKSNNNNESLEKQQRNSAKNSDSEKRRDSEQKESIVVVAEPKTASTDGGYSSDTNITKRITGTSKESKKDVKVTVKNSKKPVADKKKQKDGLCCVVM